MTFWADEETVTEWETHETQQLNAGGILEQEKNVRGTLVTYEKGRQFSSQYCNDVNLIAVLWLCKLGEGYM